MKHYFGVCHFNFFELYVFRAGVATLMKKHLLHTNNFDNEKKHTHNGSDH